MTDSFIGEIQIYGFDFAPINWAKCNGATLAIQQNTRLFSLIGTTYGGNGTSNFQLPNLLDRAACSQGQGVGLTPRVLGQVFGAAQVTLLSNQTPSHSHGFVLWNQEDTTKRTNTPKNGVAMVPPFQAHPFPASNTPANTTFSPNMAGPGGTAAPQPHENRQPALAINYCICLNGVPPTFS
ncbi:phage tail protein [Dyella psychrodurans]|uniref:Microcystin-dependent protein n=1 Tax=Dyella psychrodurans TaxID=1927960 RepID=A0A370WZ30_9GAMM|nr:tail fiber protein [Dyella psychrodurans]RDS81423.1 microcystin-dependent protein [Dyella psychrodurans]